MSHNTGNRMITTQELVSVAHDDWPEYASAPAYFMARYRGKAYQADSGTCIWDTVIIIPFENMLDHSLNRDLRSHDGV